MKHLISLLLALCGFTAATAQSIPTYDTCIATPADGATVSALSTVSISLSREGFDAPLGIMPGSQPVTAVRIADGTETAVEGVTAAVKGEQLIISFASPVADAGTIVVRIPEGVTNNLAMPVGTMTTDEIIAEGGCTNPALTLTYHVTPAVLPVRDVTGVGYDAQYLTDEAGNFLKDEKGQYIRQDKYDSLIDAQLTPSTDANPDGDRVTVLYFWYEREFAKINYSGGASVTNVTTGRTARVANVSFKTGGDSHRNDVIELRLSSEDYIQSAELHQGVYEVTLPEGIATTADGLKNGGITFRFTFGNPDEAYYPVAIDLDAYVGDYLPVHEPGEPLSDESFTFSRDDDGSYYIERLCGSSLRIPVEGDGEHFNLKMTENALGEAFMNLRGGDVEIMFTKHEGKLYIYIDQYALYTDAPEPIIGGLLNFERQAPLVPDGIHSTAASTRPTRRSFDLQGRRKADNHQGCGVIISGERKMILQ